MSVRHKLNRQGQMCKAGTSLPAFADSDQKFTCELFILPFIIYFSVSLTIILFSISGFW